MSAERTALLRSVFTRPDDDLPRLVYADYLEEGDRSDLAAATVEFIRAGCNSAGKRLMPRAAYKWLAGNWQRLVPELTARNRRVEVGFGIPWSHKVKGRVVKVQFPVPYRHDGTGRTHYPVYLTFDRGFLTKAQVWSVRCLQHLVATLRVDQPLVTFPGSFGYVNPIHGRKFSMNPLDDLKIEDPARRHRDMDTVST